MASRQPRQPQQTSNDNRFSWQLPTDESARSSQDARWQPNAPGQNGGQQETGTTGGGSRYSYTETPAVYQSGHTFPRSGPNGQRPSVPPIPGSPVTEIEMSPVDAPSVGLLSQAHGGHQQYQYPSEKDEASLHNPYNVTPPAQTHPAMYAPVHTPQPEAQQQQLRAQHDQNTIPQPQLMHTEHDYQRPPHSPGPLPQKQPNGLSIDPSIQPVQRTQTAPFSPNAYVSSPTSHSQRPIFSPDAPTGPNGAAVSQHRPGQVAHPNMDLEAGGSNKEWKNSLCGCGSDVSVCMTGLFCPCVLYGKTAYRLERKTSKKDPTDLLGYSSTNAQCCLFFVTCGLGTLLPLFHRMRIRHTYKLQGSFVGDCIESCCCSCCVLIQNEREVRDREESARRWAGPASGAEAYPIQGQMSYAPPPRH